ncbi:MAG TPA: GAF domain-containing protein, partial [Candidatus Sulfomarinibacteraceae bacterium]|nr:GAF domain-containing protein [Candidatus Sulfomarinibacteraceae bacterium]
RRRERIAFAYEQGSVVAAKEPFQTQEDETLLIKEIALNNARIGAIHLQGAEATWSEDQLELVDVVARQVAQQVENLRLLAEAERYRQEAEHAVQRLTREGWRDFFASHAVSPSAYVYDGQQVAKAPDQNGDPILRHPLQVRGEAVGELLVDEHGAVLDEDTSLLVSEVAERLSAHLENLRLTHQTESALANAERRSAELGLLNRVVTEIAGSLDLRESLQIVVEELVSATAADQARIALFNEERTALTVMAEEFDETRTPSALGMVIPVEGNALTQEVIETREPVLIDNALNNPRTRPIHDMLREQGIQSMAIMPVLAGEEVIGTVGLDILEEGRRLSAEELRLAQTVIFQAATSIQNANLFEQVQTALAETRVLYQAGAELNRARSYDDVLDVVRRHTVLGEETSSVTLVMFDTPWTDAGRPQWMDVLAFHNPGEIDDEVSKRRFRLDDFPAVERLMRRDRYGLIRDVKTDPRLDNRSRQMLLQRFKARTILTTPLVVGGQWIGHISARYPELTDFKESDLQRLRTLVGQAAVAVQSINLLEETSRLLEGEQRQRRISDTLVRATVRMMDVTDERQIREVIVDEIESLVHPNQITLYEWDRQPDVLRVDFRKVDGRARQADTLSIGDVVQRNQRPDLWRAIEEREPIQEPITLPGGTAREHYSVPWYVGSEVGGVIELYHAPRSGEVRLEDRGSIEGIIQQAAVRLQNARLYEEAELRAEELAILNEMAQALTALSDVSSVLDTVHRYSSRLLDTTNFYIALYHPQKNQISFPIFVEEGEPVEWPAREPGNSLTEYVMREREALLISGDAREQSEKLGLDAVGTTAQSWLGAPMLFGDEVSGVIAVQSNTIVGLFDEHDRGLLRAVANAAAIALQNARLFEEAQARARRERVLREITTRVRSATDVELIMKTAVREVSRALGRDAFVYLGGDGLQPNGGGEESSESTTVKETG